MAVLTLPTVIPQTHIDLLVRPLLGRLTTVMPGGYAQTHPVWYDFDGIHPRINCMREFRKHRSMQADPRISLLIMDPDDSNRWIEVRGRVELTEDGAIEHLDGLAWRYAQRHHFFGEVISAEFAKTEHPVLGRITPTRALTNDAANSQAHRPQRRPDQLVAHPVSNREDVSLPESHRCLLNRALMISLTTFMPDGQPQTQPVWADLIGGLVRMTTTRERQKGRNLELNPKATVLAVNPANTSQWIEVRGEVEITTERAVEQLDELTRQYTDKPCFYGYIYPADFRERETRIICLLHPRHVVCDAVHLERETV